MVGYIFMVYYNLNQNWQIYVEKYLVKLIDGVVYGGQRSCPKFSRGVNNQPT